MGWRLSADPQRFDEAIAWLLGRTVVTRDQAERMDREARQRAFWVGAGLQLSQVQRVFDAIKEAVDSGEPFSDFKKRMRTTLRDQVHAETVFRNATQKAYNAGRYQQMREVERWRPFWKYDAILDSRTSAICRARDGVTLPATSNWWKTNWPPLHHRCRSTVRSVRHGSALTTPPNLPPTPGWGLTPDNDPIWKPDPNKHDPRLLQELEAKQTRAKPLPRKPKANPAHDPKHWAKEYDHLGEAGPAAAYGRAMAERAYDRPAGEVLTELRRLKLAGHPALDGVDVERVLAGKVKLNEQKPLRNSVYAQRERGIIALTEHTRTIRAGTPLNMGGDQNGATRAAKAFYDLGLDASVKRPNDWRYNTNHSGRPNADDKTKTVNLRPFSSGVTAVHEGAHAIEYSDARALSRSVAFLLGRTKGEAAEKISKLKKNKSYDPSEVARPDKWLDVYIGKDYSVYRDKTHYATEVTSMGYQWMSSRETLAMLGERDPEMLYFLLGQLAGK